MDTRPLMDQAAACFGRRAFDEAKDLYLEVLAAEPDHLDALTNLGSVLLLQQDLEAARNTYRSALERKPDYLPAMLGLTNTLVMGRQYQEALDALREIEGLPDVPAELGAELRKLTGVAYHGLGEIDQAVTSFLSYAAARPDDPEPLDCLYRVQKTSGREAEALATLELMADRFPHRIEPLSLLARSLHGQGAFRRMACLFEKMVDAAPNEPSVYNLIVHLALAERRYAHARLYFEKASRNIPDLKVAEHAALALAGGLQ